MRFSWLLLLIGIVSCSGSQKSQKKANSSPLNLCRYSEYLTIYKEKTGYHIYIRDPEDSTLIGDFIIQNPIRHFAVLSSTHVGMLGALHLEAKIAAILDHRFVYNPVVRKRFSEGKVSELFNEQSLAIDVLIKAKAECLVYSYAPNGLAQAKKLSAAGIYCIPDLDWKEETALGKAEWILLFGALSGRMEEAQHVFEIIEHSFLKRLKTHRSNRNGPVLVSGNVMGDYWITPAGESYMADFYQKAGFNYIYSERKGTGSLSLSIENILKNGAKATVWINPGFPSKQAMLGTYPKVKLLPFFQHASIFCYSHDSNKYWELSVVRPDWLLEDLQKIARGSKEKLHFYKKVI